MNKLGNDDWNYFYFILFNSINKFDNNEYQIAYRFYNFWLFKDKLDILIIMDNKLLITSGCYNIIGL